jgi:hypothetical protein
MALQSRARAFIDHPQPGDEPAIGQSFLVGGIDLPSLVGVLGALPARGPGPSCRSRGQAVPKQPALEGPHAGQRQSQPHPAELDADAAGSPAGMLPAQREGGFQQWRSRGGTSPTGVITGLHCGGVRIGPRRTEAWHHASDCTERQIELVSDV